MSKAKAIVITSHVAAYENFLKDNRLHRDDYVLVRNKAGIYTHKDTIAFLLFGWQNVLGDDTDLNHSEAIFFNHNVDMIKL